MGCFNHSFPGVKVEWVSFGVFGDSYSQHYNNSIVLLRYMVNDTLVAFVEVWCVCMGVIGGISATIRITIGVFGSLLNS